MGGCWSNLPACSLSVGWLVTLRQVGEGPRVLSLYQGPKDWAVQLGAGHAPLGPLCAATICASEVL